MSAPDDRLQTILDDFARATAVRPPCEAGLDPDACDACIAFTTESLEAGVRLWGQARAPGTIKALAAEVLRLRAELAALRAPQDGYITTSRPGAAIEVQERVLSPEEIAALDFCRKPFGGGR